MNVPTIATKAGIGFIPKQSGGKGLGLSADWGTDEEDYAGGGGGGGSVYSGGGYSTGDWLRDITRGSIDLTRAVLTPPAYQSSGPAGSVTIRSQPGSGTAATAGALSSPAFGGAVNMNTILVVGLGVVALMMMMSRNR